MRLGLAALALATCEPMRGGYVLAKPKHIGHRDVTFTGLHQLLARFLDSCFALRT